MSARNVAGIVVGAVLELDLTGKDLRRWDVDSKGKAFDGGTNEVVVTANGGVYATVLGAEALIAAAS